MLRIHSKAANRNKDTTNLIITKMDNLNDQFNAFYKEVQKTLQEFPIIAASTAQNFFLDNFKRQAWVDDGVFEPWAKRKPRSKRNKGRALLVDTGTLRRSIRINRASWSLIEISTNVPYAQIHNEGFNGTQTVRSHQRTSTIKRKVKGAYTGTKKRKTATLTLKGSTHTVTSFTRKMNMPRRQFMGNSQYLNRLIETEFLDRLKKL